MSDQTGERTKFMPEDKPGRWGEGRIVGEVAEHSDLLGLVTYTTADVLDSNGVIHEDVTVTADKK